jgi:hypothetical protein
VAQGGVGEHVGRLGPLVLGQEAAGQVLGTEDVVPEEPFEGGGVADRAALELGDQDRRAVAGLRARRDAAHVRDGGGQLAGLAGADGEHAALVAGQTPARVDGGDRGEGGGVGLQAGQQHGGHRAAGGEPHQVEAQGGGTDQRVRHGVPPTDVLPRGGSHHADGEHPGTRAGRHPFAGERGGDGRVFGAAVLLSDCAQ